MLNSYCQGCGDANSYSIDQGKPKCCRSCGTLLNSANASQRKFKKHNPIIEEEVEEEQEQDPEDVLKNTNLTSASFLKSMRFDPGLKEKVRDEQVIGKGNSLFFERPKAEKKKAEDYLAEVMASRKNKPE